MRTPAAPGTVVHGNAKAGFDASNASQGYIMAWYGGSADKVKVQITGGGSTYTYNLNTAGRKEVFPLTMGDGSYTVAIYERVTGNQYALCLQQTDLRQAGKRLSALPLSQPVCELLCVEPDGERRRHPRRRRGGSARGRHKYLQLCHQPHHL